MPVRLSVQLFPKKAHLSLPGISLWRDSHDMSDGKHERRVKSSRQLIPLL